MWNHQGSHIEIVRPQCRYKQQAFMSKLSLCPKHYHCKDLTWQSTQLLNLNFVGSSHKLKIEHSEGVLIQL